MKTFFIQRLNAFVAAGGISEISSFLYRLDWFETGPLELSHGHNNNGKFQFSIFCIFLLV
jgi:hypothetical protein